MIRSMPQRLLPLSSICAAVVFIFLLCFSGCSRIPAHVGRSSEVIVVSTIIDTQLVQNHLQLYNFVPQKEKLFKFRYVQDSLINDYKNFHTMFLYGSLNNEFLKTLLREDAKTTTREDTFALFKLNNLWARGQLTIILVVADDAYLEQAFIKFKPLITSILEENYYQKIKDTYYTKNMSKRLKKVLKSYGISLDIDKKWMIDSTFKNEGFIYVHTHFPDRSIFYYKEPMHGTLTDSLVLNKRDELTYRYYNGDYILRDLTTVDPIEFKGLNGSRVKGVWQNDSLVAGGPFLSYFFIFKDTLYAIDGLLFNPGERKSDHFTALEVILNSFELAHEK